MIELNRIDLVNEMVVIALPIHSDADMSNDYEYQVRWIGGPVYYKRKRGEEVWSFTEESDFSKNVKSHNLIDWNDPN